MNSLTTMEPDSLVYNWPCDVQSLHPLTYTEIWPCWRSPGWFTVTAEVQESSPKCKKCMYMHMHLGSGRKGFIEAATNFSWDLLANGKSLTDLYMLHITIYCIFIYSVSYFYNATGIHIFSNEHFLAKCAHRIRTGRYYSQPTVSDLLLLNVVPIRCLYYTLLFGTQKILLTYDWFDSLEVFWWVI